MKKLSEIQIGEKAYIKKITGQRETLNRLIDMGLSIHSSIRVLNKLPFGGNLVVLSDYGKYTLRSGTAESITVSV